MFEVKRSYLFLTSLVQSWPCSTILVRTTVVFVDWLGSQATLERETEASMTPLRLHCLELCMSAFPEGREQKSSGALRRKKKKVLRTLLGDWPDMLTGPPEALMWVLSRYSHLQVLTEIYRLGWCMPLTSLFSLPKYSQVVMQQNPQNDSSACKPCRDLYLFFFLLLLS